MFFLYFSIISLSLHLPLSLIQTQYWDVSFEFATNRCMTQYLKYLKTSYYSVEHPSIVPFYCLFPPFKVIALTITPEKESGETEGRGQSIVLLSPSLSSLPRLLFSYAITYHCPDGLIPFIPFLSPCEGEITVPSVHFDDKKISEWSDFSYDPSLSPPFRVTSFRLLPSLPLLFHFLLLILQWVFVRSFIYESVRNW